MHPYFQHGVFNRVRSKTMDALQYQLVFLRTDGTTPDAFKAGSVIMV